jgi:hypothetical protein
LGLFPNGGRSAVSGTTNETETVFFRIAEICSNKFEHIFAIRENTVSVSFVIPLTADPPPFGEQAQHLMKKAAMRSRADLRRRTKAPDHTA